MAAVTQKDTDSNQSEQISGSRQTTGVSLGSCGRHSNINKSQSDTDHKNQYFF